MTAFVDQDLDREPARLQTGVVHSVTVSTLGGVLAADAGSGATTLHLDDVADFDELNDGQARQLRIGGSIYDYENVDTDADTLDLTSPLADDASDGDRVDVWDTGYLAPAVSGVALVALPGALASDDFIPAEISQSLLGQLPEGVRDPSQRESVTMSEKWGTFTITDVHAQPALGVDVIFNGDDTDTPRTNAKFVKWVGAAVPASGFPFDDRYPVTL